MKKMREFLFVCLIFTLNNYVVCQVKGSKTTYLVTYSDVTSNKLFTDSIAFEFKETRWFMQKKQSEIVFQYYSNITKVEDFYLRHPLKAKKNRFIKNVAKRERGKKGWSNYSVYDSSEISGYINNDLEFWTHSPRSNYFANCQVAPLIEIKKDQLVLNGQWMSRIPIVRGYPNNQEFIGNLFNTYRVIGKKEFVFRDLPIDCWEIKGVGVHDNLGESTTTFLYNEQMGIMSVHFEFYDSSSILLTILNRSMQ
jgi:hypothetical protein